MNHSCAIRESQNCSSAKDISHKSSFLNSKTSWCILACGWMFYLYEYLLRVSPSVMTEQLMSHFHIMAGSLGVLTSFYYLAYVPLQVPCGIIVDYAGPRVVVTISALFCVLGSIIFAYADQLWVAQMGRLFIGAGSACAYMSCLKISSVWLDPSKFALIAGISQMMGTLGGILGNRPLAHLVNTSGWQNAMLYAAVLGVVVAFIAWLVIKDRPDDVVHSKRNIQSHIMEDLVLIASSKQNILVGLYGCLTYLILSAFGELWGVPFLMELYDLNNEVASMGTTAIFLGFAFGSLLSSFFADYFKSHVKVMKLSAILSLFGFVVAFWIHIPFNVMLGVLFITGVFAGAQVLYFTVASINSPRHAAATTIGFTNAFVMVSGLIFQPLLGKILDFFWDGSLKAEGIPNYSVVTYQYALSSVLLVASFLAFVLMFFVKETYKKTKQ
ncbi:MAG: MFS transporter [Proteobacteria bacterium]|nr:MFS transporter [Pseudomonadota bacterium]